MSLTRRAAFSLALAGLVGAVVFRRMVPAHASSHPAEALKALELRHGGRLGVAILDSATGEAVVHRGDERFAMCSTFKLLVASLVLMRVDAGEEHLERRLRVSKNDLVPHAPVTEKRVGQEMTIAELCHAIMTQSDNPAANILLRTFEGPDAITAFARSLGDGVTRLDRYEPQMNDVSSGDERDTTSPTAMAGLLQQLVLGSVLTEPSRDMLVGWMRESATGKARLRATLPAEWNAGDKTGTNDGMANDIAVAWPPGRAPLIVTAYYNRPGHSAKENSAVLAEVGSIAATAFG